ncbi:MAG TPA: hypothetical protein VEA99_09875 [Gemmatimonadaceae bacterium]|nr:hypothetical protein [Gemmatimonadaceae bacterium]
MSSDTWQLLATMALYRVITIVIGFAIAYLGYRLFQSGLFAEAGTLNARLGENRLMLRGAAPGTFFAVLGAVVIVVSLSKGLSLESIPSPGASGGQGGAGSGSPAAQSAPPAAAPPAVTPAERGAVPDSGAQISERAPASRSRAVGRRGSRASETTTGRPQSNRPGRTAVTSDPPSGLAQSVPHADSARIAAAESLLERCKRGAEPCDSVALGQARAVVDSADLVLQGRGTGRIIPLPEVQARMRAVAESVNRAKGLPSRGPESTPATPPLQDTPASRPPGVRLKAEVPRDSGTNDVRLAGEPKVPRGIQQAGAPVKQGVIRDTIRVIDTVTLIRRDSVIEGGEPSTKRTGRIPLPKPEVKPAESQKPIKPKP